MPNNAPLWTVEVYRRGGLPALAVYAGPSEPASVVEGKDRVGGFTVPVRLVGLFSPITKRVPATFTKYSAARYSRTVQQTVEILCDICGGRGVGCKITTAS